jgi:hypothetical protein
VAWEPGGQVFALAAVMEVRRSARGHVGQYRAVVAAFAEGEVVDAGHPRLSTSRVSGSGRALTSRTEGVLAHGEAGRGRRTSSRPAAGAGPIRVDNRRGDELQSPVRTGQSRDLLGEFHHRAGGVLAAEAASA